MKSIMTKSVLGALAAALVLGAGGAGAAKGASGTGVTVNCTEAFGADNLFQAACMANQAVARGDEGAGAYTGSCAGGGACADSVYNKLASAAAKFAAAKVTDGCLSLASIQTDLTTWNTAAKPKIDSTGYATLGAAIGAIQTSGNCL